MINGPVRLYCTYPGRGGAGIAALRLAKGLNVCAQPARLFGVNPDVTDNCVSGIHYKRDLAGNLRRRWRKMQIERLPADYLGTSDAGAVFFSDRSAHGVALAVTIPGAGLLHFHWVCDFLDYTDTLCRVPESIPVVWTLHDGGAFTGGCSYPLGCDRFKESCGKCPQLVSAKAKAETATSLERKVAGLAPIKERLTVVCPSEWLAGEARQSRLFRDVRVVTIPNPHNLGIFHPGNREESRQALGLLPDNRVILFVAASFANPIKGMPVLLDAIKNLRLPGKEPTVCYLGEKGEGTWPESWRWLGQVNDENEMARIYSAADLLVTPSSAENYPNVIAEALACGVPVVASNVGGSPEMILKDETGYLFEKGNSSHLRDTLEHLLAQLPQKRNQWKERCRRFAENTFESSDICRKHLELYEELAAGCLRSGGANNK